MATNTVLSNYQLQFLASQVATKFQLYLAVFDPVTITVQSQDIATDQNGQPVNVPNMDLLANLKPPYAPQPNFGSNRIGFAGEPLFFDGSRSTQRSNLPALNHSWAFTGAGTLTTYNGPYSTGSQASITWNNPGLYSVNLTVQDRFGGITTGTRQILIYPDRTTAPRGIMQVENLTGSIDNGGWTAQITSALHTIPIAIPTALDSGVYQPVVLMVETDYELQPGQWVSKQIGPYGNIVPGQYYDDPRILFAGYVQQGSAYQDSEHDTVTFTLATVDMILRECGVHNIGYYNAPYSQRAANGEPVNLGTSTLGAKGQLVADFSTEDMYRSLLLDHCTVGLYHDLIIWRDYIPTNDGTGNQFYLTYSTLTANEGSVWDACTTATQNEFGVIWAERNGSICAGPDLKMRGYELLNLPTNYPTQPLSQIVNFSGELNNNATLGAQQAYLLFKFGPNPLPTAQESPGGPARDTSQLIGPPIAAHISDVPIYDGGAAPPVGLFPWTSNAWPQDISIRPLQITVQETFTNRATFVKLVGTLVNGNNVWASWYPQKDKFGNSLFDSTGLMLLRVAAGTWDVEDQFVLADITSIANKALSWQYLWEMARRRFFAINALYQISLNGGLMNWIRLHDLLQITRQKAKDGPLLSQMPFYANEITFTIDLDKQQWTTEVTANQVTSFNLGPIISPPFPAPAN